MCGLCCLLPCWLRPARPAAGGASSTAAAAFFRLATLSRCNRMMKMRLGGSNSNVSSCTVDSSSRDRSNKGIMLIVFLTLSKPPPVDPLLLP